MLIATRTVLILRSPPKLLSEGGRLEGWARSSVPALALRDAVIAKGDDGSSG
jgi:hypothetical protein